MNTTKPTRPLVVYNIDLDELELQMSDIVEQEMRQYKSDYYEVDYNDIRAWSDPPIMERKLILWIVRDSGTQVLDLLKGDNRNSSWLDSAYFNLTIKRVFLIEYNPVWSNAGEEYSITELKPYE